MGERRKRSTMLLTAAFCVLYLPVLSSGFDLPLPFLKEASRRNQGTDTNQNNNNNNRQKGSLSELLPSSRVNNVPKGELSDITTTRSSSPPRHIVKLLENMSKDQDLLRRSGNTVRSAVPVRKNTCGKDTFIFSLRTLELTEQLDSVELHYFVRKLKRYANENLQLNIQIHHINNDSLCSEISAFEMTSHVRGWQKLNLTAYIESFMNETSPKIKIGVTFTATSEGRERVSKSLVRKMLSKHVQPFMLVFTEDKTATDEAAHLSWDRLTKDLSSQSRIRPANSRRARSISNSFNKTNSYLTTNNFPDDQVITNMADATFPIFAERNSQRRKERKKEKEKKEKKRRNKKKKEKKNKFEPLLDHNSGDIEDKQNRHDNEIRPSKLGLCSRQPMRVDFNAIGWDGYVIAPEGFDAYYCAGECPFPLAKELHPSNHATIQSVVSALGAIPNIPAPCCVAEKMSPISILFFDEDDNVLLKSYSNMQVDSCSCR